MAPEEDEILIQLMVSHRTLGIRSLALFWQLVIVSVSFWGWFYIWEGVAVETPVGFQHYIIYNEFLLIGILFGLGDRKQETGGPKKDWIMANNKTLRQSFYGIFSVFLMVFAMKDSLISRTFLFSYLPWLYSSLLFTNLWLPQFLGQWTQSSGRRERMALIGTPDQIPHLQSWLDQKRQVGLEIAGLISPEPVAAITGPIPVLGTLDAAKEIFQRESITQLVVLNLSLGSETLRQLTHLCESEGVRLLVVHDLNSYFNHNITFFEDDGVRFIGLRDEPLENPVNRMTKRALDLAVSLPVVLFLLPFISVAVWLVQRIYSPGPLFFVQERNGMLGRTFKIYKFRTMHVHNDDESRQARKEDARIFPAGIWMRKLSIDELPQFFNVVMGDMSLVGPRPHMPIHDEMFAKIMKNYVVRRLVQPGITGWAQVSGFRGQIHNETDVLNRVQADIFYLENWSLSVDLLIILKTIKACVFPPATAY